MFWTSIRCNLRDPNESDLFNRWYNDQHAPRYIRQPGFRRGWRLERLDHPAQRSNPTQRYLAIYETDTVSAFNAALARDLEASHPWGSGKLVSSIGSVPITAMFSLMVARRPQSANSADSGRSSESISKPKILGPRPPSMNGTTQSTFRKSAVFPASADRGGSSLSRTQGT